MSVSTSVRKQSFAGGQATNTFTFKTLPSHPEYIKVIKTLTATGVETAMTYTTEYSVALGTDGVGGVVTFVASVSTGYTTTVYRETTDKQESDYDDYNQFPADTVESDLDRRTLISQERSEDTARSLKLPISSASYLDVVLPIPVDGAHLAWSGTGGTLVNLASLTGSTGAIGPSGATGAIGPSGASVTIATAAEAAAGTEADHYMSPSLTTIAISTSTLVAKYSDARFKVGTFTRDMTAASGDVAYTGVGFVPNMLFFFAGKTGTAGAIIQYFGAVQNPNVGGVTLNRTPADAAGPYIWSTITNCIGLIESGGASQTAVMKTYAADGFTLTWTKTGSPSANTLTMGYVAFR